MSNSPLPDPGKPPLPVDKVIEVVRNRLWGELRKIEDAIDRLDPPMVASYFDIVNVDYIRDQLAHIGTAQAIALACAMTIPLLQLIQANTPIDPPADAAAILDAIDDVVIPCEGGAS